MSVSLDAIARCRKCGERDVLNCFHRCPDCELAYQKDVLLETWQAVDIDSLDNESLRLIAREFAIRAAELLARGAR
jgi:hypothetical protein